MTQGGIYGRREATSRGLYFVLCEACAQSDDMRALGLAPGLEGKRIVVQGLGNVGYYAAKFCREGGGAIIIAIAEREGAIMNVRGLDEEQVRQHRTATGSILGFPGATDIPRSTDALELDCDVLIPAALENQLTAENAPRIRARIILKGANGPTTPEGDEILRSRGALLIPDIYANAGGVTVSYFEWPENLSHVRFGRLRRRHEATVQQSMFDAIEQATGRRFSSADRGRLARSVDELTLVNSGLEDTMISAYHLIRNRRLSTRDIPDLRTAAFVIAIEKVGRSYQELRIFP